MSLTGRNLATHRRARRFAPGAATTIEQILNGVVVGFEGVSGNKHGFDLGVWDNAARIIPLFP